MSADIIHEIAPPPDAAKQAIIQSLGEQIPYLRRYARSVTRNIHEADDLAQSALVKAIAKIDQFQSGTNLRTWLLSILHSLFIDGQRRKQRGRKVYQSQSAVTLGMHTAPNQIRLLEVAFVQQALLRLPAKQRATLMLIALEGLNYEEAAAIMQVPVGTVKSRLTRARRSLLEALNGKYTGEEINPPCPSVMRPRPTTAL